MKETDPQKRIDSEQYYSNVKETAYFAHLERNLRAASGSVFDQQLIKYISPEELARRDYVFGEIVEQSAERETLKHMLRLRRESLEREIIDTSLQEIILLELE